MLSESLNVNSLCLDSAAAHMMGHPQYTFRFCLYDQPLGALIHEPL